MKMKLLYILFAIVCFNCTDLIGQSLQTVPLIQKPIDTILINNKKAVVFSDKTWEYINNLELQKSDSLTNSNVESTTKRVMASASLSSRNVVGSLPLPSYNSQNQGRVIVTVTVDQNGVVTNATAQAQGSTAQDASLWKAAKEAALKARFNVKKDAPVSQTGTITYNL